MSSGTTNAVYTDLIGTRATPPSFVRSVIDITGKSTPYAIPQGPGSPNGGTGVAGYQSHFIEVIGTLTANLVLKMPLATGTDRNWRIQFHNNTTGSFSLVIEGPTGGSGITLTQTKRAWLQADTAAIIKEPEF